MFKLDLLYFPKALILKTYKYSPRISSKFENFIIKIREKFIGSGDHDMCVPYTGSEAWTRSLGYKIVDKWRTWIIDDQVAGYLQAYDHNLTFLTIKVISLFF